MPIYVNYMYMHVFLFLQITEKIRPFCSFKMSPHIVVQTFNMLLNGSIVQFSFISFVFYCFAKFLCLSLFLQITCMYFIGNIYGIV